MRTTTPLTRFVFAAAIIFSVAAVGFAQGPPGHDRDNAPPGHGGVPPGQAKKYAEDHDHHDWDHDHHEVHAHDYDHHDHDYDHHPEHHDHVPPGQAKKYEYRWRDEDRARFYSHYHTDAERWRGRKRPVFVMGQPIPQGYVVSAVPASYWVGAPPPPPGFRYGYYGGYMVAYDPATRVVADVKDLISVSVTIR
jgi:hypothetical protein